MIVDSDENKFIELISKIPNVAVQGYDRERNVIYWNSASENIYGYSKEEALGNKLEDLIIPDFMRDDVIEHHNNWYTKGISIPSLKLPLQHKDGSTVFVYSSHVMLGVDRGNPEMFCVDINLTKEQEQEEKLKQKDLLLINQSRHAAMGEMIGMIAHQWRQPLSIISMDANNMLADIALDNFDSAASEEYAQSIIKHTQHLSQTIDDFRNFFKPDREVLKVNIRETIDQTLSIVQDSLRNNNIPLTSTFETEIEVDAYPRELMQVFVNIITNAKDALVHNEIKDGQIDIRVYEDEKYLNTEICDNGGGIDENILSKIFDPYFSTKDEKTGTGLGLYMSKMIIEEHLNGIIEAHNNDDGACFTVRLLKVDMSLE